MRLEFWQQALPLLEKVPAKYFTKSGYARKAFQFLERIDNEIADKYGIP